MIELLLRVALGVVKVVALPLLLPQKKPPSEAVISPGPSKLAMKVICLGVIFLVADLILGGRVSQTAWPDARAGT